MKKQIKISLYALLGLTCIGTANADKTMTCIYEMHGYIKHLSPDLPPLKFAITDSGDTGGKIVFNEKDYIFNSSTEVVKTTRDTQTSNFNNIVSAIQYDDNDDNDDKNAFWLHIKWEKNLSKPITSSNGIKYTTSWLFTMGCLPAIPNALTYSAEYRCTDWL